LTGRGPLATLVSYEGEPMAGPTTVDDLSAVDGLTAAQVHALEQGDAALTAALYAPGDGSWRYGTGMRNSGPG
jgi:hypothetical protein